MGDMTNHALDAIESAQGEAMEYLSGDFGIDEAYERGLLDHNGAPAPSLQEAMAWANSLDMSPEGVDWELERIMAMDAEPRYYIGRAPIANREYRAQLNGRTITLNEKAYANLSHEAPTCNVCEYRMRRRSGRYGDFFFCYNGCADQKTVGLAYWQAIKEAFNKV